MRNPLVNQTVFIIIRYQQGILKIAKYAKPVLTKANKMPEVKAASLFLSLNSQ